MDFIENCDVVVSPTHVVDDDVFVNLDAFDMLGEFPDLEGLESGHASLLDVNPSEAGRSGHGKSQSNSNAHQQSQQHSHHNGNSHQEGIFTLSHIILHLSKCIINKKVQPKSQTILLNGLIPKEGLRC